MYIYVHEHTGRRVRGKPRAEHTRVCVQSILYMSVFLRVYVDLCKCTDGYVRVHVLRVGRASFLQCLIIATTAQIPGYCK